MIRVLFLVFDFFARIRGTQPDNDDDDDDDEHFAFAGNISRKHGDLHFPRQTRENDQQIDPQAKARHSLRLISSHTPGSLDTLSGECFQAYKSESPIPGPCRRLKICYAAGWTSALEQWALIVITGLFLCAPWQQLFRLLIKVDDHHPTQVQFCSYLDPDCHWCAR